MQEKKFKVSLKELFSVGVWRWAGADMAGGEGTCTNKGSVLLQCTNCSLMAVYVGAIRIPLRAASLLVVKSQKTYGTIS